MSIAVELPALGESVVEGTVSRWLVKVGDYVEIDQPLVEVTTDKVDAEIPAPAAGAIAQILVAEGEVVEVGTKLVEIDPDAAPSEVGSKASEGSASGRVAEPGTAAPATVAAAGPPATMETDRRATPVARRLAEEANVELEEIRGSGAAGRVTKQDVIAHAMTRSPPQVEPAASQPARSAPAAPVARQPVAAPDARPEPRRASRPAYTTYNLQEGDRVIPMSPMRRIISEHMVYSKRTSPHVGTVA